jgi:hypothetical protein
MWSCSEGGSVSNGFVDHKALHHFNAKKTLVSLDYAHDITSNNVWKRNAVPRLLVHPIRNPFAWFSSRDRWFANDW